MQTARELDIMQIELDKRMELFLEEFVKGHLGERMNDAQITNDLVANGRDDGTKVHMEAGRQPVRPGGAVQYDQRGDITS